MRRGAGQMTARDHRLLESAIKRHGLHGPAPTMEQLMLRILRVRRALRLPPRACW